MSQWFLQIIARWVLERDDERHDGIRSYVIDIDIDSSVSIIVNIDRRIFWR